MIVVAFDFAKNDSQPGYFSDLFEKDIRPEKKWPNAGTQYVLTMDAKDDKKDEQGIQELYNRIRDLTDARLYGAINSAISLRTRRSAEYSASLRKNITEKLKKRHKLRWFCDDDKADGASVPGSEAPQ